MDFNERLDKLEAALTEINERQIREDERRKLREERQHRAWEFLKSVLVPVVVALITVWMTK